MTYTIPNHKKGDTWIGIETITINRNGQPLDLTNAKAIMQVRFQPDSPIAVEFSSDNNTILFTAPTSGILQIPSQIVDIPAGKYLWDLQIILSTGEVKTFLEGDWTILNEITR